MEIKNDFFCITVKETEKVIFLKTDNIKNTQNCQLHEFTQHIKEASKLERNNNGSVKKITATKDVLNYLDEWFMLLVNKFQTYDTETLAAATEILRFLRNCTSDLVTQQYILEKTNILNNINSIFSKIMEMDINNICLKVLLQFLINLMSSNKEAGEKIFTVFYDRVKKCLQLNINIYECSALIYYISLIRSINDVELINLILDLYCKHSENEFLIFFLENNISNSIFWHTYKNFKTENKVTVLETLKNMQLQRKPHGLPLSALGVLEQEFLKSADSIFNMSEKEENRLRAYEVSLLLEMLSSVSSDENYLETLQNNKNILINAGVLLINMHKLGKESNNCFTPVQKLTEFKVNTGLNEHPAFGFKADLIRLIGNLCWKNVDMQNLARTAELIPIILDCCNMDAKNPFIIQWSVLAVRNLCKDNQENQRVIAGLHREGTVSSELLNEMGITLHSDAEGALKIVPLESLNKN